jgi:hypothetical protein
MHLAISSDEDGQQICSHVRNWRVITLFTLDNTLILVYVVYSLTTYLYKTNINFIFPFTQIYENFFPINNQ